MTKLATIGSAARQDDANILRTAEQYEKMYDIASALHAKEKFLEGVSGGAAWSDHVIVTMGLRGLIKPSSITLFIPAEFSKGRFIENGSRFDTGRTSNYYHSKFSACRNVDTLGELAQLQEAGARLIANPGGFQKRNSDIAHALWMNDVLLAFTTGGKKVSEPFEVFDGTGMSAASAGLKITKGTADTWDKAACRKLHVMVR